MPDPTGSVYVFWMEKYVDPETKRRGGGRTGVTQRS